METYPYEVRTGECISSIAEDHGFHWKTLWNLPQNTELRCLRKNPNVLLAGDVVAIPPLRERQETCTTDALHVFRRKGTPAKLVMRFVENGQPLGGEDYVLDVDGAVQTGKLDQDGFLEVRIKPNARKVTLAIGEDEPMEITLGSLDPVTSISGVQGRLRNLGYNPGPPSEVMGPEIKSAIREFQRRTGVEPTGEMDAALQKKLIEAHGS